MSMSLNRMSVRRANYRTIEVELYNYHATNRELMRELIDGLGEINEEAYYARQAPSLRVAVNENSTGLHPDLIRAGHVSDPTYNKFNDVLLLRRRMLNLHRETVRRLKAVEWMVNELRKSKEPNKLRLVQLKYLDAATNTFNDDAIMQELNIARATFYRWQREIIGMVARKLGWHV